ncbi:MAG: glycine--tRNA ligase [Rhodospirillaceae bacterium]|nr:glycine--tRNA ligase [Rhodospirillaceae bacterium]|tara:strand:+ start:10810 stop:12363 length:1554 start_codon:yes stop_codon:yes gene_type:complete
MDLMDKLVSLAKRRGFIFPSSEIYGGLNGCWDYGPMGVELKRNVKEAWWQDMVARHDETQAIDGAPSAFSMVGLDSSILMNPRVWEASGHVSGFSDPMVDCRETRNRYRADQLVIFGIVKDNQNNISIDENALLFASPGELGKTNDNELLAHHKKQAKKTIKALGEFKLIQIPNALADEKLRARTIAPSASKPGTLTEPRSFNLMFQTHVGALKDNSSAAYLRPETAQGIFANFKNVCDTARVRLPFGIAQLGKAFRNEINPRNFTFRSREFEQMEIEFFCKPEEADDWYLYWRNSRYEWYINLGIQKDKLHLREHETDELAHYAKSCADVEYEFPFGVSELEGIANRSNFDLRQHMEHSGKDLRYLDDLEQEKEKRRFLPYVIEPSAGADRATLAFMCNAYTEDEISGEKRTVMKFHPKLAPIKAAIFPLVKKDGMPDKALSIYRQLRTHFPVSYDEKGAIGRRYRRQDEAGTPFCVTIDGETMKDDTVTLRERDTCEQIRLPINEIVEHIVEQLI